MILQFTSFQKLCFVSTSCHFSAMYSAYRTLWCNANCNVHRYFQIPLICTTDLLSCFSSKAIKNLYAQVGMDHQSMVEVVIVLVFSDGSGTGYPRISPKNWFKAS